MSDLKGLFLGYPDLTLNNTGKWNQLNKDQAISALYVTYRINYLLSFCSLNGRFFYMFDVKIDILCYTSYVVLFYLFFTCCYFIMEFCMIWQVSCMLTAAVQFLLIFFCKVML